MKVRALVDFTTQSGTVKAGKVAEFPDHGARALIARGWAEPVTRRGLWSGLRRIQG